MRLGVELVDFVDHGSQVEARLTTLDGTALRSALAARSVADGVNSLVRHLLRLDFKSATFAQDS